VDGLHLVPVATGLSDFEAKLLAAQLGAEGILWQMRGIVDSIYPFGGIDVLVPSGQLDDARHVAAAIAELVPVDVGLVGSGAGDEPSGPTPEVAGSGGPTWWLGIAAVGAVVAVLMVRVFALI